MGQQNLIYSFVARGTVILSEYTEFSGNFTSIASQCLQKLPATNNKFTYNCDGHTFNFLVSDGFTYCVVAVESVGRQIPMAFLERVKDDFNKRYGGGKAATAVAKSLNKEFGPKLKEHMQYCVDHPDEMNKLAKVQAQISEVKGVMMENIEKVLDRGEKIELLVDKTENLRSQELYRESLNDGFMTGNSYLMPYFLPQSQLRFCGLASLSNVLNTLLIPAGGKWEGTRLQDNWNTNEEKDVASKHEDQAHCVGHHHRIDPNNCPVGVPWVQLWQVISRRSGYEISC